MQCVRGTEESEYGQKREYDAGIGNWQREVHFFPLTYLEVLMQMTCISIQVSLCFAQQLYCSAKITEGDISYVGFRNLR